MAAKKRKKAPRYNPLAGWNMSTPAMENRAREQAQAQLQALLSALPTGASLKSRQAQEAAGLGRINTAFTGLLQGGVNDYAKVAQGVGGAFNQAFDQARQSTNATSVAAGGPQTGGNQVGGLLAAMGANWGGALQGGVQAGAAVGALTQQASLARLAEQLKARSDQATQTRQRYGSLYQDALDRLYGRAFQQQTAADNSRLAWSQFGEQAQQNDINNAQQDAAQAQQAAQAQAGLELDWAQLNAQQSAALQTQDARGKAQRQALIKKARAAFVRDRRRMSNAAAPVGEFTFDVVTVDDDGAYKTVQERVSAANAEEARTQMYRRYPPRSGATLNLVGEKRSKVKKRVVSDRELADRYRKELRKLGFQQQVVNQLINNWLRKRAPESPDV